MTAITVFKTKDNQYKGFSCSGHAGFQDIGKDIVCASISILVINTINAIEKFTDQKFSVQEDEKKGRIELRLEGTLSKDSVLLLDAMVLGLTEIQKNYSKFCKVNFKEV
ncbi:MAG: ribosomal-processing cysteine protease Prp [Lachnospiraceae bacterium]|jgi:hypothetical protein|nr:ribosomal-processing cysteine protease Prp [Lachnospiraceae bacterium]